jgi:hypothetical protein
MYVKLPESINSRASNWRQISCSFGRLALNNMKFIASEGIVIKAIPG